MSLWSRSRFIDMMGDCTGMGEGDSRCKFSASRCTSGGLVVCSWFGGLAFWYMFQIAIRDISNALRASRDTSGLWGPSNKERISKDFESTPSSASSTHVWCLLVLVRVWNIQAFAVRFHVEPCWAAAQPAVRPSVCADFGLRASPATMATFVGDCWESVIVASEANRNLIN